MQEESKKPQENQKRAILGVGGDSPARGGEGPWGPAPLFRPLQRKPHCPGMCPSFLTKSRCNSGWWARLPPASARTTAHTPLVATPNVPQHTQRVQRSPWHTDCGGGG